MNTHAVCILLLVNVLITYYCQYAFLYTIIMNMSQALSLPVNLIMKWEGGIEVGGGNALSLSVGQKIIKIQNCM